MNSHVMNGRRRFDHRHPGRRRPEPTHVVDLPTVRITGAPSVDEMLEHAAKRDGERRLYDDDEGRPT